MTSIFQEGRDAFTFGRTLRECPYPVDSDDYEEWREGWHDAKVEAEASKEDEPIYGEVD